MKWCCLSSCMLTDGNSSRRDNPTAGSVPWRVSDPWQAGAASTIESSKQPPLKYHPRTQCVTFWRISLAFVYTCDPLRLELMFQHALLMAHMTLFGAVLLCFASFFLSFFFFFGYLFLSISFLLASMSVWLGVDRVFFFYGCRFGSRTDGRNSANRSDWPNPRGTEADLAAVEAAAEVKEREEVPKTDRVPLTSKKIARRFLHHRGTSISNRNSVITITR